MFSKSCARSASLRRPPSPNGMLENAYGPPRGMRCGLHFSDREMDTPASDATLALVLEVESNPLSVKNSASRRLLMPKLAWGAGLSQDWRLSGVGRGQFASGRA